MPTEGMTREQWFNAYKPEILKSLKDYESVVNNPVASKKAIKEANKNILDIKNYINEAEIHFGKQRAGERQPEEVLWKTEKERKAEDVFTKKAMKKNNMTSEDLRIEGLNEGVFGEFAEGIIKLKEGLWQPADFFHENLHRLKAFARASKNTKLIKLIERGEKLAVNTKEYKAWKKKNLDRDVEEFLADVAGLKAQG